MFEILLFMIFIGFAIISFKSVATINKKAIEGIGTKKALLRYIVKIILIVTILIFVVFIAFFLRFGN